MKKKWGFVIGQTEFEHVFLYPEPNHLHKGEPSEWDVSESGFGTSGVAVGAII